MQVLDKWKCGKDSTRVIVSENQAKTMLLKNAGPLLRVPVVVPGSGLGCLFPVPAKNENPRRTSARTCQMTFL
jgi:hypothetical protein